MPGKPSANFKVSNLDQWGRLVKSWATGLNYVDTDYANQPPLGEDTVPNKDAGGKPLPWCLPDWQKNINVSRARREEDKEDKWVGTSNGTNGTVGTSDSSRIPNVVAMSRCDFMAMVGQAGVDISSLPKHYTTVVVVQGDDETIVLKIPAKKELQEAEADLIKGVPYPLPSFYAAIFHGPLRLPTNPANPADRAQLMWLHADRMGEYALNNCN
jgi:hypothetical protein